MVSARLDKNDVPVRREHLDMLVRKARAHDAYLWATKRMADRTRAVSESFIFGTASAGYLNGYHAALQDFAAFVRDAPPTDD